jgi:hypothetical protein
LATRCTRHFFVRFALPRSMLPAANDERHSAARML